MNWIDLRSDTVTEPTESMRSAMASATVGDDVYQDDPTVAELESYAAKLIGKEAALFVPSGTFANQLAIFTHCNRGDEVILGEDCHIVAYEVGAAAAITGVQLRTLETTRGIMNLEKIQKTIRQGENIHWPKTSLICLENAYSNGVALHPEYMEAVSNLAKAHDVKIHLDGARIFNAAASLNIDVRELTEHCDSLMFCLSKGLCAPIGSILAGSKEFIEKARKNRKLLGGGLRQAGFLAAAGIVALEEIRPRLADDHKTAQYLADRLDEIPGVTVHQDQRDINMVFCQIETEVPADEILKSLLQKSIKVNGPRKGHWRFATHYWISQDAIDLLVNTLRSILVSSEEDLQTDTDEQEVDLTTKNEQEQLDPATNDAAPKKYTYKITRIDSAKNEQFK